MSDILDSRVVSQNDLIGQKQIMHFHEDGGITLETKQDATEIIKANRQTYNQVDERAGWKGEFHRVASIPMSVWFQLKQQGILDDQAALKRWLNDSNNAAFRTRPGKV